MLQIQTKFIAQLLDVDVRTILRCTAIVFLAFFLCAIYLGVFVGPEDTAFDNVVNLCKGLLAVFLALSLIGWILAWKVYPHARASSTASTAAFLAIMVFWFPIGGPLALYIWRESPKDN